MSEYSKVLDRIGSGYVAPPSSPVRPVPAPARGTATVAPLSPVRAVPRRTPETPIAEFYENLRALLSNASSPCVVFSAPEEGADVGELTRALEKHSSEIGQPLVVADLKPGRGGSPESRLTIGEDNSVALDLNSRDWSTGFDAWRQRISPGTVLTVIRVAPTSQSLDGVLLARRCDGLVLVVRSGATTRKALESSVSRAATMGCQLLGLVVTGTPSVLPAWLRSLLPMATSPSLAEDSE